MRSLRIEDLEICDGDVPRQLTLEDTLLFSPDMSAVPA
jgi:hypothetical protein